MDKNTMSNHGWIVIVALVLVALIGISAVATNYISNGAKDQFDGLQGAYDYAFLDPYDVEILINNAEAGAVSVEGHNNLSLTLKGEQELTLSATVNDNYTFTGWYEGDTCLSTETHYTYTAKNATQITAVYRQDPGLYDADDNLVASWEELTTTYGMDVVSGRVNDVFNNNPGLSTGVKLVIDGSITSIGSYAFSHCTSLTSITIPDSVTSIGDAAFYNCTSLTNISVDDNSTTYKSVDGNLYSKDGLALIQYSAGKTNEQFAIPDSVTSIGANAFYNCANLTSITIPDGVTSIGNYAFSECIGLTSLHFNATNMADLSDGNRIFYCAGANSGGITVTIGKNVTRIPTHLFISSSSDAASKHPRIISVVFEEDSACESIGRNAFSSCTNLTSITIPDSVTSIDYGAFKGCTDLTSVIFGENSQLTGIGANVFTGTGLTSIAIPDSVTSIGLNAFDGCTDLTSIIFGENSQLTGIGASAFKGCTSLANIVIPDSVTSIGDSTFFGCTDLINITISDSVTSIGQKAFQNCTSLTSIEIPSSVTSIGYAAFDGCNSLVYNEYDNARYLGSKQNPYVVLVGAKDKSIATCSVHMDTKTIMSYAFYGCTNLETITIPDSVTSIGDRAFMTCSSLMSVIIPDSVTRIGERVFQSCTSLTSISFEGTAAQWTAISKGSNWKYKVPATEVICSNGTVTLS